VGVAETAELAGVGVRVEVVITVPFPGRPLVGLATGTTVAVPRSARPGRMAKLWPKQIRTQDWLAGANSGGEPRDARTESEPTRRDEGEP
jgi:hypothetical protein